MSPLSSPARAHLLVGVACLLACSGDPSEPPRLPERGSAAPSPGAAATTRSTAVIRRDGNHLIGEPSPYLQQHAHNPVDWYPWGEEALARARRENKPIFLSIGYSTCHWCHVMEEESFENDEVAAFLNEHFVSIKVDREQRPDVDAVYMDAVAAMGGSTGWPLTVFLTPELLPYYGGTYFPPRGNGRRPGFMEVLNLVLRQHREDASQAAQRGRSIFAQIDQAARRATPAAASAELLRAAMTRLERARDRRRGGFGSRQKFPNSPLLLAELRYVERTGDASVREHLVLTLEEAMRGGIRDHLAGTFHRYAVDPTWHVPHFERMLYDNAQLAQVYVEAGSALSRPDFTAVGRAILDDLVLRWQQEDGGFVVGFDADDPEGEGFYYTWTPAELNRVLGSEDGARFATLFGVTPRGDRQVEGGRSVLHRRPPAEVQSRLSMSAAEADAFVARVRPQLLEERSSRQPPAMDDKELAAWNGLAITALANCGRWLGEPRYIEAAQRAARFVVEDLFEDGVMLRGRRRGESLGEGFLDDHSLPALGLLRLHAADGDPRWLMAAREIGSAVVDRFYDRSQRAFMSTARPDNPDGVPLRRPDMDDGVLPSGGTAAILLMLELGAMTGDRSLLDVGERALERAAARARDNPFRAGYLMVAIDHVVSPRREVVLSGDLDDERTRALFEVIRPTRASRVLPIRVGPAGAANAVIARYPALRGKTALDGIAAAYVCEIGRCELPTSDPATLRRQLP